MVNLVGGEKGDEDGSEAGLTLIIPFPKEMKGVGNTMELIA